MWGCAFLGIATLLMSGYYKNKNQTIAFLLIANGIVSIACAIFAVFDINWVMTTSGLIAYFAWNILMIVLMLMINIESRNKNQEPGIENQNRVRISADYI
jgi:hypothetical protein